MDAEDAHRLLMETRLRCRLLEADKDVETLRADKYRKIILDSLTGEDRATQPQAAQADISHLPRCALMDVPRPTSSLTEGQVGSTMARCPSVHPPVAGRRAAAVLRAHSDSDADVTVLDKEPHTEGSTSTSVSQPDGKKRNLSSYENHAQRISTRSRSSFDIPLESSRIYTFYPYPRRSGKLMPRDIIDVDVAVKRAGLMAFKLTRAEATRVEKTPGIGRVTFSKLFGGNQRSEWPQCSRLSGYSDFLCADVIAQPFAPNAAGKPGLLLRIPTVIETPETEERTIHVLSNTLKDDALYYLGKYTRVPIPVQIPFHWFDLPRNFRDRWVKRVVASRRPAIRALRARIQLRNNRMREPSDKEVQAYLQVFNDQVTYQEIADAFWSGKEKMVLEGLRCTGYDSHLATIIQRTVEEND